METHADSNRAEMVVADSEAEDDLPLSKRGGERRDSRGSEDGRLKHVVDNGAKGVVGQSAGGSSPRSLGPPLGGTLEVVVPDSQETVADLEDGEEGVPGLAAVDGGEDGMMDDEDEDGADGENDDGREEEAGMGSQEVLVEAEQPVAEDEEANGDGAEVEENANGRANEDVESLADEDYMGVESQELVGDTPIENGSAESSEKENDDEDDNAEDYLGVESQELVGDMPVEDQGLSDDDDVDSLRGDGDGDVGGDGGSELGALAEINAAEGGQESVTAETGQEGEEGVDEEEGDEQADISVELTESQMLIESQDLGGESQVEGGDGGEDVGARDEGEKASEVGAVDPYKEGDNVDGEEEEEEDEEEEEEDEDEDEEEEEGEGEEDAEMENEDTITPPQTETPPERSPTPPPTTPTFQTLHATLLALTHLLLLPKNRKALIHFDDITQRLSEDADTICAALEVMRVEGVVECLDRDGGGRYFGVVGRIMKGVRRVWKEKGRVSELLRGVLEGCGFGGEGVSSEGEEGEEDRREEGEGEGVDGVVGEIGAEDVGDAVQPDVGGKRAAERKVSDILKESEVAGDWDDEVPLVKKPAKTFKKRKREANVDTSHGGEAGSGGVENGGGSELEGMQPQLANFPTYNPLGEAMHLISDRDGRVKTPTRTSPRKKRRVERVETLKGVLEGTAGGGDVGEEQPQDALADQTVNPDVDKDTNNEKAHTTPPPSPSPSPTSPHLAHTSQMSIGMVDEGESFDASGAAGGGGEMAVLGGGEDLSFGDLVGVSTPVRGSPVRGRVKRTYKSPGRRFLGGEEEGGGVEGDVKDDGGELGPDGDGSGDDEGSGGESSSSSEDSSSSGDESDDVPLGLPNKGKARAVDGNDGGGAAKGKGKAREREVTPDVEDESEEDLWGSEFDEENRPEERRTDFTCRRCLMDYSTPSGLKAHRENGCSATPPIKNTNICNRCRKRFNDDDELEEHRKECAWECEGCGKEYKDRKSWKGHVLRCKVQEDGEEVSTPVRVHVCEKCGKEYQTRQGLKYHVENCTREGEVRTPAKVCGKCGKEYRDRKSWKNHVERCRREDDDDDGSITPAYVCEKCGKGYQTRQGLKYHVERLCTGKVTPPARRRGMVVCEQCGKEYRTRKGL
ncbi:hypothetical protein HDV00_010384, partial [Rhizophlyctis rosea]